MPGACPETPRYIFSTLQPW